MTVIYTICAFTHQLYCQRAELESQSTSTTSHSDYKYDTDPLSGGRESDEAPATMNVLKVALTLAFLSICFAESPTSKDGSDTR